MLEIGLLKTWDAGTYKAAVQFMGSLTTYFDNISVSVSIDTAAMVVGNYVIVAIPNGNPKDACVIAAWPGGSTGIVKDHGGLTGLADDDHSQYLNNARHDLTARHTLGSVVPHDVFTALTDTPSSYSGQAGKYPKVNAAATALEFGLALDAHKTRHEYGGADVISIQKLITSQMALWNHFMFFSTDGWTDFTSGSGGITRYIHLVR